MIRDFRGPRLAWGLFAAHSALIVFSTVAMLTVLTGRVDVSGEPAATIMRISYRFAGPTYVLLGALAAITFTAWATAWRLALIASSAWSRSRFRSPGSTCCSARS